MGFYFVLLGFLIAGFASQLCLIKAVRRKALWVLPTAAAIAGALYGLLRLLGIIRLKSDGAGFIDVGPFIGIIILCFTGAFAAGIIIAVLYCLISSRLKSKLK